MIATGVQYGVREFITKTAHQLGVALAFEGEGVNEVAKVAAITGDNAPALQVGQVVVRIDPRYFRPTEVETLIGEPSKAKRPRLGAGDHPGRDGARNGGPRPEQSQATCAAEKAWV